MRKGKLVKEFLGIKESQTLCILVFLHNLTEIASANAERGVK